LGQSFADAGNVGDFAVKVAQDIGDTLRVAFDGSGTVAIAANAEAIFGCDLSRSRVSKVEKILSPSLSVNTQAPSMYFLSPDATLSAAQCADILSSIFSPFMFCVVPTASRLVAVPRPAISMLISGRKMKCVT